MFSLAIPACASLLAALPILHGPANGTAAVAKAEAAVTTQQGGKRPRATVIAVINPRRVRVLSRWAQSLLDSVDADTKKDLAKIDEVRKQRAKLGKELELWEKGSREYKEKQLQIGVLGTRIQNMSNLYQNIRDVALARALLIVRQKMQIVVAKLAAERGIDLVIQKTGIPEKGSVQQKFTAMQTQLVFFAKPELDLTTDVAKLLDSKVKGGGKQNKAAEASTKK